MPVTDAELGAPLQPRIIRNSLAVILESPGFVKSLRLRRFLEYIVECKLAGREDDIQEYSIGVEVFDRRASFDPRRDSIVRVEAHRLRDRLEEYYAKNGCRSPVRIVLPERGYVPSFERRKASRAKSAWMALILVCCLGAAALTFGLARAPTHHEPTPQAREAFEKGVVAWNQWTSAGARQAERFFQQAIDLDPNYARAHAWLGASYRQQATMGDADPRDAYAKASHAAAMAISLDPQLSDGYHALATNLTFKPDWPAAEKAFRTAIRLAPDRAENHHAFGIILLAARPNRLPEAEAELRRAVSLEPGNLGNRVVLAKILYFRGRFQESRSILEEALAINAHYPDAMRNLAAVHLQTGNAQESLRLYEKAQELAYLIWGDGLLGHALAISGDGGRARAILATLEEHYSVSPIGALAIGTILVGLKDWDSACAWIRLAWNNREIRARFINVDPIYAPLSDKACFASILGEAQLAGKSAASY